jgi:hypothetical protein
MFTSNPPRAPTIRIWLVYRSMTCVPSRLRLLDVLLRNASATARARRTPSRVGTR